MSFYYIKTKAVSKTWEATCSFCFENRLYKVYNSKFMYSLLRTYCMVVAIRLHYAFGQRLSIEALPITISSAETVKRIFIGISPLTSNISL